MLKAQPVQSLDPAEAAAWNDLVAARGGSHLQTTHWGLARRSFFGDRVELLRGDGGGLLFGCGSPVPIGPGDRPTLRLARPVLARLLASLTWEHGPLTDKPAHSLALIDRAVKLARKRHMAAVGPVTLPYLRPDLEAELEPALLERGFVRRDQATFLLDLTGKSVDELWSALSQKARNKVRKAEKAGLELRRATTVEEIGLFEEIIGATKRRAKISWRPELHRRSLALYPDGIIRIYLAWRGDKAVAAQGVNCFNGYWRLFSRSMTDYARAEKLPGPDYLQWKMIEQAALEGGRAVDWLGANLGASGGKLADINTYKAKWGNRVVHYGAYTLVLDQRRWDFLARLRGRKASGGDE